MKFASMYGIRVKRPWTHEKEAQTYKQVIEQTMCAEGC